MPALARTAPRPSAPRRAPAQPFSVLDLSSPVAPPSAALIATVLAHADIEEEAGAGRVRRRVSAPRLAELEAMGLLDAPAARAADLTILWDEREGEIVRVLDDAPAKQRAQAERAWWEGWDEPAPPRPRLTLATRRAWGEAVR
jgi:hypothetical protein